MINPYQLIPTPGLGWQVCIGIIFGHGEKYAFITTCTIGKTPLLINPWLCFF